MGDVRVRLFQVEVSLNADGTPEVFGIATPYEVDLAVNLAKAVSVNCLATPATGPARYATLRHEARLLACLLGTSSTSSALHLDSAFRWSARHIRGFVAECAGLGLLTATAEEFFGWRANPRLLHHFDALPTRLTRVLAPVASGQTCCSISANGEGSPVRPRGDLASRRPRCSQSRSST